METMVMITKSADAHIKEKNQTFKPGQKVVCNRFLDINATLPVGIKKGGVYLVDEVQTCECGNTLLVLNGANAPEVKSRICPCGTDGFKPNAFYSRRFDLVHLNIVR